MELISKYKIDRDEEHNYTVEHNGAKFIFPGVTGILDTVGSKDKVNRLMGWAKKQCLLKVAEHMRAFMASPVVVDEAWIEACRKAAWKRDKEVLQAAGDLGTRVHSAIDAFILGQEPVLDADTKMGYDNFREWLTKSGIKILKGDTYIAHLALGFGGAMDALGEKDGKLIMLDWKTGNSLQDTASLQSGAYSLAFEDTFGMPIYDGYVVRFGKEVPGDIEPRQVNMGHAKEAFMSALNLKNKMEKQLWI